MSKLNINGAQNVEVSKKLPPELSPDAQLDIMEKYTKAHAESSSLSKAEREVRCLSVLYPATFKKIEEENLIAGSMDVLPIGFGSVTSLGGVGHFCVFAKLLDFKNSFECQEKQARVQALYDYWVDNDLKVAYCKNNLRGDVVGQFINCDFPLIATARMSGMMLNYNLLLQMGIDGLRKKLLDSEKANGNTEFLSASQKSLDLFVVCAESYKQKALASAQLASGKRKKQLERMALGLENIKGEKPQNFHDALQLFWLYSLLAGVINYGRLDDYLGEYFYDDIKNGVMTEEEGHEYLKSLWSMIEKRRTTVNGRIIVGGRGRKNPTAGDFFAKACMRVAKEVKFVEPQFTLRITDDMDPELMDMALDTLGVGATYPTLYNDEVNIPAVMNAMRVDEKTAEQYVPFGCGEFVIVGKSSGTPNTCVNLLKLLNMSLNCGVDSTDGIDKSDGVELLPCEELTSFDMVNDQFKRLVSHYLDLSIDAQYASYVEMNKHVSFLFTSILMDDCIGRGKAMLDGGLEYLGGTNETYGNINASDSLSAIKHFVFDTKKYTLRQLVDASLADFASFEDIRKELWNYDKYGNDIDEVDNIACDLFNFVAKGVRDRGIKAGMQYYLIVISNNQLNTEWGRRTSASLDGRHSGTFMNPANNPSGGASRNGPIAVLNSLAKFEAKWHGGSVQNIKFSKNFFCANKEKIKSMFKTYFKRGGCHIMVTVIDEGILEKARQDPENYRDLIVRVSGFSAIFVNLEADVQDELMSRVMYG